MLATVEEEDQRAQSLDDTGDKLLPSSAVRPFREQDLKYLRHLGMCGKVDERDAVSRYQVTPVDTKCIDINRAFEEEPMQIRSQLVARVQKWRPTRLVCGDASVGSVQSKNLHGRGWACHVRAFMQKAREPMLVRLKHVAQQVTGSAIGKHTSRVGNTSWRSA